MEKKSHHKKDKYKLQEPVLYPPLTKSFVQLEADEEKFQEMGEIIINLLKQGEISIYKLLYNRGAEGESVLSESSANSIRNEYLKKIVESNDEYFPHELALDKFKRRPDVSFEEKLKAKIASMAVEKPSRTKKEKKVDLEMSRKVSNAAEIKINADEALKVVEEQGSENEEQEERSFEDEEFLNASEDGGDAEEESGEANFSDGGVF